MILCLQLFDFILKLFGNFLENPQQKTPNLLKVKGLFHKIVLEAGLEPARPYRHRILSPACLPIPPLELKSYFKNFHAY